MMDFYYFFVSQRLFPWLRKFHFITNIKHKKGDLVYKIAFGNLDNTKRASE